MTARLRNPDVDAGVTYLASASLCFPARESTSLGPGTDDMSHVPKHIEQHLAQGPLGLRPLVMIPGGGRCPPGHDPGPLPCLHLPWNASPSLPQTLGYHSGPMSLCPPALETTAPSVWTSFSLPSLWPASRNASGWSSAVPPYLDRIPTHHPFPLPPEAPTRPPCPGHRPAVVA